MNKKLLHTKDTGNIYIAAGGKREKRTQESIANKKKSAFWLLYVFFLRKEKGESLSQFDFGNKTSELVPGLKLSLAETISQTPYNFKTVITHPHKNPSSFRS